ncbi:MAG: hypothetical protein DHS20C16_27830 [Phycisphaerae bacterium]|nr:MAG: hypothetical protein DHS20C16_27830 [Phycisphaerae bacterium]
MLGSGEFELRELSGVYHWELEARCENDSLLEASPTQDRLRELSADESLRRTTLFASNGVAWSERSGKEKEPQASIRPVVCLAESAATKQISKVKSSYTWFEVYDAPRALHEGD